VYTQLLRDFPDRPSPHRGLDTSKLRAGRSELAKVLLPSDKLRIKGLALRPYTAVLDLEPRLRCRECDARGKAVVSIKWGA
jgi:hypothetical protein